MKTTVVDEYGLCILRDASVSPPEGVGLRKAFKKAALESAALGGSMFFIDREDPIRMLVEVRVDEAPDPYYLEMFHPSGGRFLLRLPTGALVVSGYEAWATGAADEATTLAVPPGDYSVAAFHRDPPDMDGYQRAMERLVGVKDLKFSHRVTSYGAAGCLPLIITILAGIFVSWQVGLVVLGALAIGWLPYVALALSPRYRRIEKARRSFEDQLPAFILRLQRVQSTEGLAGGFVA